VSYIHQMAPAITDADARAVAQYMTSGGWITEFEHTRRFAQEIAERLGARYCVITPSGTAALFLALAACDVGRDDEVIVPDLTMAATATAPILAGAKVVFADIEPRTLCLDLDRAEAMITERTKAVIVVSLNGRAPAGLPAFVAGCRARGVRVVEDAAQSMGSTLGGRALGTIGDCGIFSFSPHKIVTTGQGGAVVTDDEALYQRMRMLRDFGRASGGSDHYLTVGWNLKFTDLQAVLGVQQISRLPQLVETKRRHFARYRERLAGVPGVTMVETDLTSVTPWFIDPLVDPAARAPLMAFLHEHGVGSRPFYPALHAEPAFAAPGSFPVAEAMSARGLWLPSSLGLTESQVDEVCALITRFFER
jgi:perosamine synthetase